MLTTFTHRDKGIKTKRRRLGMRGSWYMISFYTKIWSGTFYFIICNKYCLKTTVIATVTYL